jgi:hypothetical protein
MLPKRGFTAISCQDSSRQIHPSHSDEGSKDREQSDVRIFSGFVEPGMKPRPPVLDSTPGGEGQMTSNMRANEDERLEELPAGELEHRLMELPVRRRLEVILGRADAELVVAGLADQDFFVTVKELGPQDTLPLLALATVDQLNHVFDIEWWRKDAVLPASALEWLELLSRAGDEKVLLWLYHVDFELLTLLFKRWIRVVVLPEDVDLVEARESLPVHTIDDQFFWECRYPQYEDLVQHLLRLIFETHQGFYLELMNHILWLPDAECEEEAYRFHRGRLEDRGVPDFYDSLTIYRAPRPQELRRRRASGELPFEGSIPAFALALVHEGDLFRSCLAEMRDNRLLDTLGFELASLANKVLVADELPPDQPRALQRAADKAAAYVNLGLTLRTGGGLHEAASLLKDVYLEDLFRLGHARVAKLRSALQNLVAEGWPARWPHGILCLDSDWLEWAELILQKTPQLRRKAAGIMTGGLEDFFRTPQDIAEAEERIQALLAMGRLFDALWEPGPAPDWLLMSGGLVSRMEDVTLSAMIWTAASQFLRGGEWRLWPIPVAGWDTLWARLEPDVIHGAIHEWASTILPDERQLELAGLYLAPLEEEYAHQMAPFLNKEGASPDPRLMKFFIFGE